jgi:hypothetical protein
VIITRPGAWLEARGRDRQVAKVRVYELAKEFGVESQAVMDQLKEMGEFVRSASSTIEAPVVKRLREAFAAEAARGAARPGVPRPSAPRPTRAAGGVGVPRPSAPRPTGAAGGVGVPRPSAPRPGPPRPSPANMPSRPPRPRVQVGDGRTRRALSLGIASFGSTEDPEPDLEAPSPLPFAVDRTRALCRVLVGLGYQMQPQGAQSPPAELLGQQVSSAITAAASDDILVVHVLSHGHLAESGAVYVVGADGGTHALSDVEHWLKTVEDFPDRPYTIFLLDLCHGGVAARLPWQVALADGSSRAWVIAACEPDQRAFDGRFTQAVANVLGRLYRSELDIDRSVQYVPLATIAREIRREVDRLAAAKGALPQQVTCSVVDLSARVDLPFFPNPDFLEGERSQVRGRIDTALAPFLDDLDDAFDPRHFIGRAAGHGPLADRVGTGCFSGREDELIALTGWMNGDEDGPIRLVTGSAGVGKSALIGVLVCAAHPVLRRPTKVLWERVARVPGQVAHIAAVHARQRGLAEVTESLARQLGFNGCASPGDLVAKVRQSPTVPLLVVDALDEALEPASLMDRLLSPLIAARDDHGAPACRLMVGVRSDPAFADLRAVAVSEQGLIDLDNVSDDRLRRDLDEYVDKLLKSQPPYHELAHAAARATFAAAVAETLVSRRAGRRWGEFLVAALYTHHLLTTRAPVADVAEAAALGLKVPSELREVLELDLRHRSNLPSLRAVLAVLAHALGEGMPAGLIRALVPAFASGREPSAGDVAEALETARFYLRHTADTDGTTIYRLFHQGLADYLRQHPVGPDIPAVPEAVAQMILSLLLSSIAPPSADTVPQRRWDLAEPYLLRHALQHAIAIGQSAAVAADPEFLVHADPSVLGPYFAGEIAPELHPIARTYERFLDNPGSLNPEDRRRSLAFAAAAEGLIDLGRRLANPPGQPPLPWQPVWRAKWHSPAIAGNPARLTFDPVRTVIAADFTGGPAVVAGTKTGMAVSWDLETGKLLHHWPLRWAAEWELTELRIGSQPAVLVSLGDRRICLDPVSGDSFPGPPEEYFSVKPPQDTLLAGLEDFYSPPRQQNPKVPAAFSVVDRRIVMTKPASGHTLAVRNFLDGSLVAELADERSGPADALATWVLGTRPVVLSGSKDGTLAVWDLKTGKLTETLDLGQPIEMIVPAPRGFLVVVTGGEVLVLRWAADPPGSGS